MAGHGPHGLGCALCVLPGFAAQIVLVRGKCLGEILPGYFIQGVAPVRGGQEIGRNGRVKDKAPGRQPPGQRPAHHVLDVIAQLRDLRPEKRRQKAGIVLRFRLPEDSRLRPVLPPAHRQGGQLRQGQDGHRCSLPLGDEFLPASRAGHVFQPALAGDARLRLAGSLGVVQAHLADELLEAQLHKQGPQRHRVHGLCHVLLGIELDGGVPVDGAQVVGPEGTLPPGGEFFLHAGGGVQGLVVQAGVDLLQGPVLVEELHGRLLPHPRHTGDVVGGVAHEGFQVHHLQGAEAIGLLKGRGVHLFRGGLAHAGGDQLDVGPVCHELQGILVSGGHPAVPARLLACFGDGADEVVSLPARQLVAGDVHGVQHLFQHRHLHGQLLRHPLPLGLVVRIGQVAEGRLLPVEGHAHAVRVHLLPDAAQDIQKAIDGVGGKALLVVQGVHPVVGPVDDGVAVDHQQLHPITLLSLKKLKNFGKRAGIREIPALGLKAYSTEIR